VKGRSAPLSADAATRRRSAQPTRANHQKHNQPPSKNNQQGSITEKVSDWALGLAIPVHMQISTNALVTDYVPARFRPPARGLVLAGSLVAYLGIMKVNLGGPGLTRTVKALWGADVGTGGKAAEAAAAPAATPAAAAAAKK
jgi:succinate dehydrogenase (ubiquinone) membrane anchor subunit